MKNDFPLARSSSRTKKMLLMAVINFSSSQRNKYRVQFEAQEKIDELREKRDRSLLDVIA